MAFINGENIIVKVAALSGGSRVKPASGSFKTLLGTSTGVQLTEAEQSSAEFGTAASLWEDAVITKRGWSVPFSGNYHPTDEGYVIVEAAAISSAEVFVQFYPEGTGTGKKVYEGVASITGFQIQAPREGIITNQWTFKGRAALTIAVGA